MAPSNRTRAIPLTFAPATTAVDSPEARDLADGGTCGESFDPGDFAQDFELHRWIVSMMHDVVNNAKRRKSFQFLLPVGEDLCNRLSVLLRSL
jgi:hypothetical protein